MIGSASSFSRGHSGTSLPSRARSAVSRDDCRRFIRLNRLLSLTFECGFLATQKLRFESKLEIFGFFEYQKIVLYLLTSYSGGNAPIILFNSCQEVEHIFS